MTAFQRLALALGAVACLSVLVLRPVWTVWTGVDLVGLASIAVLGIFLLRLATRSAAHARLGRVFAGLGMAVLVLGLLEGAAARLLARDLEHKDDSTEAALARRDNLRHVFDATFLHRGLGRGLMGTGALYEEHHYLPYVLNPKATYGETRQFDAYYHIRRTEPLRPRSAVKWRALALGGSTTFGERLEREEDTWVHRLEDRVRAKLGPDCDVINGGVGGYTLNENIIHYTMLLTHLEPDVVILYEGINDVEPRWHSPGTMPDYSNFWKPWHGAGTTLPEPVSALAWSSLYRLWFFRARIRPMEFQGIQILSAKDQVGRLPDNLEKNGPWVYASHLEELVRLLLAQGRKVLIVPQYFREAEPHPDVDRLFMKGVAEHNAVNEDVAKKLGVPFANVLPWLEPNDTGDDCHFTARGSDKFAALVYEALEKNGLVK
ncbi:MAG TPA: SGNH/GDSL hydrolase family protein [Planctomycetota bacterium]|nr:SGNH/GDSL hydrolase family protein [Planctomycetota bacterium]